MASNIASILAQDLINHAEAKNCTLYRAISRIESDYFDYCNERGEEFNPHVVDEAYHIAVDIKARAL